MILALIILWFISYTLILLILILILILILLLLLSLSSKMRYWFIYMSEIV